MKLEKKAEKEFVIANLPEGKQSLSRWSKHGVSLVTVLMFMLVATIAATATYKWITSEGHSSASRMMQREAYQSAMAGIENTRAWMTYNANDVGALIKQYRDGGNKAIKINRQLKPGLRAGQNFDVWLTGVDAGSAHNFKLKFLSTGKGRDNTEHSEVAIFNVDGLYTVTIPAEAGTIHFDKAFDGATTGITGSDALESGLIHGDFSDQNNIPKMNGNFVISGNMGFGGTVHAKGDVYLKGSLTSGNGAYTFGTETGGDTNVVYIGGSAECASSQTITVYGDLYVAGDFSCNCKADVRGNFTVGGTLCNDGDEIKVGKNWVFTETGKINNKKEDQAGKFNVTGNVYLPRELEANCNTYGCGDQNGNRKAEFGGKIYQYSTGNTYYIYYQRYYAFENWKWVTKYPKAPYIYGAYANIITSQDNVSNQSGDHCPGQGAGECKKWRLFSIKANEGALQSTKVTKWAEDDDVLKDIGDNYWHNLKKMEKYGKVIKNDNSIPQAILLKNPDNWRNLDNFTPANKYCGIAEYGWLTDGTTITKLNTCYKKAEKEDKLYNGFLVIRWEYNQDKDPGDVKLNGNFLIHAVDALGTTTLPATEENSVVMLYLQNGTSGQIKGKHGNHPDWVYNYFIYSDGDIVELNGFNIRGNVTMAAGTTLKKYQGNNDINFKKEVLNALQAAGFITENPEYLALAGIEGGGQAVVAGVGAPDEYFVAASPMLNVSLVSQYENRESVAGNENNNELNSSYIVLPRVIRMPKNPRGKLGDYYDIVNLNGGNYAKDITRGVCNDFPAPTSLLYDRKSDSPVELTTGTHSCTYTAEDGSKVKFYVKVTDESLENVAYVYFDKSYQPMGKNSTDYVTLVYPKGSNEEFKVRVSKPSGLTGTPWSVTPVDGIPHEGDCNDESTSCVFTLHFDDGSPKNLFEVKTTNAESGTYAFDLDCISGCEEGPINTKTFSISSVVNIARGSLQRYCNLAGVSCSEEYTQMTNLDEWPDCTPDNSSTAWIKAVSYNTETTSNCSGTNSSWTCGIAGDIKLVEVEDGVPQGCQVVIPSENNTLSKAELVPSDDYTLYGALKAKKFTFHVGFDGDDFAGKMINVTSTKRSINEVCSGSAEGGCDYELFTGDDITLTIQDVSRADFSYWKCDPSVSTNCPNMEPFTGFTYNFPKINGDNSVVAWFGQRDKHCFFDEFKTTRECTGEGTEWKYCFNYCSGSGDCRIGNGALTDNAKWLVIGDNALRQKLNYADGKIWLDNSYNSHKKQSDIAALKVMSTVQAGLYGALVGQFQVPRMGRGDDKTSAPVNKSGFMLRSNDAGTQYLFLNVYANSDGKLAVKACVGGECSEETLLSETGGSHISVGSTDIVTLTAEIKKNNTKDELHLSAVNGYYGNYHTATAVIVLSDISEYSSLAGHTNEYVGFSLADPDFKVYDLGWKSEDYNAECWQTAPTIKCSFKAAYVGGIVPLNKAVTPWVGFSSWFNGKDCEPQFQYKGSDACGGTTANFSNCGESYTFSATGAHGSDNSMAKAGVDNCNGSYLLNTERALAYAGSATCGTFWVGETKPCRRSFEFFSGSQSLSSGENVFSLGVGEYATLRDASIKIEMDNPSESELEVYLKSETDDLYGYGYYGPKVVYSKSATTTAKTEASFNVMELANEAGFDPERVFGVIIRNLGSGNVTITKIYSVCDAATNVQCKDVVYEGGAFKARAKVEHADNSITKYKITGEEAVKAGDSYGNYVTKQTLTKEFSPCPGASCPNPDASDIVSLGTESYNPYANDGKSKKYRFKIEAEDDRGAVEGSGCYTSEKEMSLLAAECRWSTGSSTMSVQQGKGLPDFQYKLPNCGNGNCGWEVIFSNTSIVNGTGVKTDWTSIPSNTRAAYNTVSDPLSTGTTYTIAFRNKSGATTKFEECELQFTVTDRPPDVTCEFATASGSHEAGSSVTLSPTVTGCDAGDCKYKLDDGRYENSIGSFNAPTEAGSYEHTVSVQRGTESAVPCGTYTVNVPLGGKCGATTVSGTLHPGDQVQPPTPTISGCNSKCNYDVKKSDNSSAYGDGTQTGYDGTRAPATFTAGNDVATDGTATQYNLVISHQNSGVASKTCPFSVTYAAAPPSSGCHCADYCGSGCESNLKLTGSYTENPASSCFFFTSAYRLNINEGYKINRDEKNGRLCHDNADACATALSSITPDDGGYYFKGHGKYADIIITADYNPCSDIVAPAITSCPSVSAPVGGTVNITPTATGCLSREGCNYTLKNSGGTTVASGVWRKGSISFKEASDPTGNQNYTLTFTNTKGSDTEKCSVTYKNLKVIDGYDKHITVANGGCFVITQSGSGNIRCGHGWQSSDCSITVSYNGSSSTMTDNNCNNSNGNPLGATFNPTKEACVTITGASDADCFLTTW